MQHRIGDQLHHLRLRKAVRVERQIVRQNIRDLLVKIVFHLPRPAAVAPLDERQGLRAPHAQPRLHPGDARLQ